MNRARDRGHPLLFVLSFGTMVAALVGGDLGVALLAGAAVVWTVVH